ncbi:MAG: OmpA family protein [Betaproteobacteria bacterium]|nr:OmpA family protein [Betaproteobacteria bacterium]
MQSRSKLALATTLAATFAVISGCASDKPAPAASTPQQASTAATSSSGAQPSSTATSAQPAINSAALTRPSAQSVFFDYDSFSVKNQYANDVRANTDYMMKANINVELGGNADERGSREYNMALGQKRADAVKRAMTALGAKGDKIETISYGEDKPRKTGHDEASWAENRRVDIVAKGK